MRIVGSFVKITTVLDASSSSSTTTVATKPGRYKYKKTVPMDQKTRNLTNIQSKIHLILTVGQKQGEEALSSWT
jgi:hypothetical protein